MARADASKISENRFNRESFLLGRSVLRELPGFEPETKGLLLPARQSSKTSNSEAKQNRRGSESNRDMNSLEESYMEYDAIVIGSGQGGTPLASALAGAKLHTALI